MEMMEQTEEQTTYSVTLEDLAHGQSETNGETGGGGTDGETGGSGTGGETGGGTTGSSSSKEDDSTTPCDSSYDIQYNLTISASGEVTGNGSFKISSHGLAKILAKLGAQFGYKANGDLNVEGTISGRWQTGTLTCKDGPGNCTPRPLCGQL